MEPVDLLERCYPGRRAESKRHILKCALALFNQQGIEATTIDVIRAESEMSVGAIYHHFNNKEGLVAALYMTALDDQARLRNSYLSNVKSTKEWVYALVYSYVDWVVRQPDWARFQYQARFAVARSSFNDQLQEANLARNAQLKDWFSDPAHRKDLQELPFELLPSLLIGSAESYCRAWLSARVKRSPELYRQQLAEAAWRSVGCQD
ncbi:TetR/AcrR family transcriptional regulator [Pseudomonas sp. PDM25]|jgi:AcrR family transcriptional regulator|uniref:TetR/AcrR family transcriptional regulator n=1 Tax=Pseudomonas sp. PDM25 TaxID=2854772 RepID=UPI001C47AD0A|nr:TetR/AcrR family transcriptional regulator [Pseudomonas sp. PDM25]MBV7512465.1 TetR/AcrR family transcriptional regulator [Pseudomonas sp. PDM25]